jgi:hypothetical protein
MQLSKEEHDRQLNKPKQALSSVVIISIIIAIFALLIVLDYKYKVNFFSNMFSGLSGLFTS